MSSDLKDIITEIEDNGFCGTTVEDMGCLLQPHSDRVFYVEHQALTLCSMTMTAWKQWVDRATTVKRGPGPEAYGCDMWVVCLDTVTVSVFRQDVVDALPQ